MSPTNLPPDQGIVWPDNSYRPPPSPSDYADALLAYGRRLQWQQQKTPPSIAAASNGNQADGYSNTTHTADTPAGYDQIVGEAQATDPLSGASPIAARPPSAPFELTAGRDDSDDRRCNQECHPILERPKPYPWSDRNEYDYRKCMRECLNRSAPKFSPTPQTPSAPQPLPWWMLIPRIAPDFLPALAQGAESNESNAG